jgi:formylglycine-generating enzyme
MIMKKFAFLFLLIASCSNSKNFELPKIQEHVPDTTPVISEPIVNISSACESHMTHIHGLYCPSVEQHCKRWKDDKVAKFARCLEYDKSVCISDKIEMNFCIDTYEFSTNYEGLPVSNITWTQAQALCEANDKRLCSEEEWNFACEGEEIFPYTTGYIRPTNICNMDIEHNVVCGHSLCDLRKDINANPECKSPFGVVNMSGNVDEWINVPKYAHSKIKGLWMPSALKGGHWLPVRNRCRPVTEDHEEKYFRQISIGFRCCNSI